MDRLASHAGPYALGTFRAGRHEFAGVVVGDQVRPVATAAGLDRPTVRDLIEHWIAAHREISVLAAASDVESLDLMSVDVLPPVEPRQIFQSGANYRSQLIERELADRRPGDSRIEAQIREQVRHRLDERTASGRPYIFAGLVSALCGAYDDVVLPAGSVRNQSELELAAVIGRPARRVSPEQALSYVLGYTIVNDITTREWVDRPDLPEMGTDWIRSKNSPTFLPAGPFIVPAEFIGDPMGLRLTMRLNGQVVQDESTKDMVFDIAQIVSYCSHIATLLPGDLVLTGSPGTVGDGLGQSLRPGDVMEAEITGLGMQRNGCITEDHLL